MAGAELRLPLSLSERRHIQITSLSHVAAVRAGCQELVAPTGRTGGSRYWRDQQEGLRNGLLSNHLRDQKDTGSDEPTDKRIPSPLHFDAPERRYASLVAGVRLAVGLRILVSSRTLVGNPKPARSSGDASNDERSIALRPEIGERCFFCRPLSGKRAVRFLPIESYAGGVSVGAISGFAARIVASPGVVTT